MFRAITEKNITYFDNGYFINYFVTFFPSGHAGLAFTCAYTYWKNKHTEAETTLRHHASLPNLSLWFPDKDNATWLSSKDMWFTPSASFLFTGYTVNTHAHTHTPLPSFTPWTPQLQLRSRAKWPEAIRTTNRGFSWVFWLHFRFWEAIFKIITTMLDCRVANLWNCVLLDRI